MRPLSLLLSFVILAALAACSGVRAIRGEVVHPALVPVRSFPRIWVVRGQTPQEGSFAAALAHHLEGGAVSGSAAPSVLDAEVEVVDLADLEPARASGRIPPATVVLLSRIRFRQSSVTRWTSRPQTVCGSAGCYRTRRSYQYDVPTLDGEVTLTVYDGPTATVQQEVKAQATEEGRGWDEMENRVVVTLVREIGRMVDQRLEVVDIAFLEVDVDPVEEALALVDAGDWQGGRAALEAIVVDEGLMSTLEGETRARVLYDLGMARLYDPATLNEPGAHFDAARDAIAAALALDPTDRYQRALDEVEEHQRRFEQVRQQDEATAHNYLIGEGIPEPPAAYQRTPRAPGPGEEEPTGDVAETQ